MRLLLILISALFFIVGNNHAQTARVYSNTGTLVKNATEVSQGAKLKSCDPGDFFMAYKKGFMTSGIECSSIIEGNTTEYTLALWEAIPLEEDYNSKRVVFAKFVDKSGNIPTKGTYSYWGYVPGINLESEQFLDGINEVINDWGYKTIGGDNAIFKEKQEDPDLVIAGEITNAARETKGTAGFKVGVIVNWSVFSVRKEKVVYELITAGYSDSQKTHKFQDELVLALQDAVVGLLANEEFKNVAGDSGELETKEDDVLEETVLPLVQLDKASDYAEVVKNSINSVITVKTEYGHGSGFLISTDGHALTNTHVIEDAEKIEVIFNNNLTLPAEVIVSANSNDVTLLKIVGGGYQPLALKLTDEETEIGSEVIAIGTPENIELGQTVTKGIVSGYRNIEGQNYIQTDVSINPGNSGGALLNDNGEVIGIVVAKIVGSDVEGLGFAIPVNEAIEGLNIKFE